MSKLYQNDIDKIVNIEKEKLERQTMVRLTAKEHEDISKISKDNIDPSISATIRRLIKKEIKRFINEIKGE